MRLANNAQFYEIHHRLTTVLLHVVDPLFRKEAGYELTITSANDSKHGRYSRHYAGLAVDIRTWVSETSGQQMTASVKQALALKIQEQCGDSFLIIPEATHIHISYKPDRPVQMGSSLV